MEKRQGGKKGKTRRKKWEESAFVDAGLQVSRNDNEYLLFNREKNNGSVNASTWKYAAGTRRQPYALTHLIKKKRGVKKGHS